MTSAAIEGAVKLSVRVAGWRVRQFLAAVLALGLSETFLAVFVAHEINEWPIGRWGWAAVGGAALVAGGIVTLQILRESGRAIRINELEKEVERTVARMKIVISESFDTILESLCRQVSKQGSQRKPDAASLQAALLASASGLLGPERSRANFYEYIYREVGTEKIRELHLRGCHGRQAGRERFSYNRPDGKYAIKCIGKDLPFGVSDVQDDPPEWFDLSRYRGKYRSFIAMPVKVPGRRPLGMLTVDSPDPDAFVDSDFDLLRVYSQILAASLLMVSDTNAETTDDV